MGIPKPSHVRVWPNRSKFHQNQAGSNNDNIYRTHFQCLNAMLSFTSVRNIYLNIITWLALKECFKIMLFHIFLHPTYIHILLPIYSTRELVMRNIYLCYFTMRTFYIAASFVQKFVIYPGGNNFQNPSVLALFFSCISYF